ncbi:MAG TPA: histidine phosphatase family protein [Candidatus Limnocylindrales bacterium]|nr:histidine phosphatase family protein [Candidatus Limnocylindrales bacterium]
MPILDVRRHAERTSRADNQSPLSANGLAMCARLADREPKYALVVSSPLPRAKETAERIAGRLDSVEAGLLPDLGSHAAQLFGEMKTLADWARLLHEHPDSMKFAEEQLPVWARIVSRLKDKDKALAVSHGGIIDLPAVLLMERLRVAIKGDAFGYCDGVRLTYTKGEPTAIEVLRA